MGAAGPAPPAIILTDVQPVRRRSGRWEALGLTMVFCTQSQQAKADSTLRSSQAVPHPSTNRALRRLTSEVGRDPVCSTRYGRQREMGAQKRQPFISWHSACFGNLAFFYPFWIIWRFRHGPGKYVARMVQALTSQIEQCHLSRLALMEN